MSNIQAFQASECERVVIGLGDKLLGMSLRDYFAASCIGALAPIYSSALTASIKAYEIADAMLKARDATK